MADYPRDKEDAQTKILRLDARLEEVEDFSTELQGRILELETQIEVDQDLAAEAQGRTSEMENQLWEEKNHARQARRLATETQAKLHQALKHTDQQLREKVMSLECERDNMKVIIKNQEYQICQFQSLAFEGFDGGLESLQCNIKAWAGKYAIDDMNSIKEILADNYEIFLKALGNVVRLRTKKMSSNASKCRQ
ncbi:hypothetical protein B0T26DRAFT_672451 [Lasiosphaeria miniovina]|uniref:Uncharacterized protein n=1 Tax=Lasiosphaeria miniovina TaxID=1954250 RepID=A0AA40EA08_9PEZI|nr:uncharacterized protein B0T26DRAFT_672451 [Lasiosphaeria miniovina]KAK0727833.1 hypothetical protein B0T26DRAFT_672451 [Lasiosphaeria miniovina]